MHIDNAFRPARGAPPAAARCLVRVALDRARLEHDGEGACPTCLGYGSCAEFTETLAPGDAEPSSRVRGGGAAGMIDGRHGLLPGVA